MIHGDAPCTLLPGELKHPHTFCLCIQLPCPLPCILVCRTHCFRYFCCVACAHIKRLTTQALTAHHAAARTQPETSETTKQIRGEHPDPNQTARPRAEAECLVGCASHSLSIPPIHLLHIWLATEVLSRRPA